MMRDQDLLRRRRRIRRLLYLARVSGAGPVSGVSSVGDSVAIRLRAVADPSGELGGPASADVRH